MAPPALAAARRWLVVGIAAALLASLPWAVARLPAGTSDISAQELAELIEASDDVAYSGYAEAVGGLALPITNNFAELADLLGDRTAMRVWHGSPTAQRVDAIDHTGETDVYTDELGTWSWDYEAGEAIRTSRTAASVSIPAPGDLLPPPLARRVLSNASGHELARLPSARIAGRSAPGLRLTPSHPAATVDHVDVWADESTGLALRVAVYGTSPKPAMDSAFLDIDLSGPDADLLRFEPPPGARVQMQDGDLIAQLQQRGGVGPVALPPALAGFGRTGDGGLQSTGIYGDTLTTFAAIALPERVARSLRFAIDDAPTTRVQDTGLSITSGPLSALLADTGGRSRWLLAGTVSVDTLVAASRTLLLLGSPG